MTMALPIEEFKGNIVGVLLAEVNLKYVWDVVSSIKPGKAGYAYAVSRSEELIAHPDISLVFGGGRYPISIRCGLPSSLFQMTTDGR